MQSGNILFKSIKFLLKTFVQFFIQINLIGIFSFFLKKEKNCIPKVNNYLVAYLLRRSSLYIRVP